MKKSNFIGNPIAHKVGINGKLLLDFFESIPGSENGQWFTITQDHIESATCLTKCKQRTALSKLINAKIVESIFHGYPAQKWYRINTTMVIRIVEDAVYGKN